MGGMGAELGFEIRKGALHYSGGAKDDAPRWLRSRDSLATQVPRSYRLNARRRSGSERLPTLPGTSPEHPENGYQSSNVSVTGNRNRPGPALPEFRYSTSPRTSLHARCECPLMTAL